MRSYFARYGPYMSVEGGDGPPAGGNSGNPARKTFSQEQLDDMFADKANQARSGFVKGLGYDSAEALKADLDALKKAKQASQTEHERALQQAREEAAAETRRALEPVVRRAALQAAILREGGSRFRPNALDDVVTHVERLAGGDRPAVTVNADGTVTGLKAALDKLAQERDYLVQPGVGPVNGSPPGGNGTPPPLQVDEARLNQIREENQRALRGRSRL